MSRWVLPLTVQHFNFDLVRSIALRFLTLPPLQGERVIRICATINHRDYEFVPAGVVVDLGEIVCVRQKSQY
ncbi:MAG TPA: hypothetical protein VK820_09355 [Steroidobacteraceae bacterium]|jgi:hypothetical protein|nr:hypothetical protein [Steroidobacteraceae bacterium]